jgi:hypothetical protein
VKGENSLLMGAFEKVNDRSNIDHSADKRRGGAPAIS